MPRLFALLIICMAVLLARPALARPVEAPSSVSVEFVGAAKRALSTEERAEIRTIAVRAISDAAGQLPGTARKLRLQVHVGDDIIPETGEAGAALNRSTIKWTINHRDHRGTRAIIRASLRGTIFHEMHHLARGWTLADMKPGLTIVEAALAEGLATAFARDAAGVEAPWADYPAEADKWLGEIAALPAGAPYADWMFYHPDGRRWIGYRAGTYFADRLMAVTGKSAADLAAIPLEEAVRLAIARNGS